MKTLYSDDAITDEEIEEFYRAGVLGNKTPRALLNTVWMNHCIYFGMRPGQEQRDLCCGDLELKTNADGLRYVKFSTERQTKTRTGENTEMSEKASRRCSKTLTIMIAVLSQPIWPISNIDHQK